MAMFLSKRSIPRPSFFGYPSGSIIGGKAPSLPPGEAPTPENQAVMEEAALGCANRDEQRIATDDKFP